MRILAIRGRNLASLSGDFAIDFTAEPLAGSGIFAITGPTGAGKSTLLDAVCLALFNEVPRLRAAPASGKIGVDEDSGLSIRDTRAILRHGAGDGFAEVDFAMPGGARYRARWSVRRARGRPDGRMQHNDHAFERLDTGERLGGTRTETTDAIQRVVGLTVEQFGRAVLLAQGDFEAFIRADSDVRALLLERLTGSEIYTRLGKAAFEKGRAFEVTIQALRTRLAEQNGLDDVQREEAETALAAARETEAAAAGRLEQLRAVERWEQRAQELAGEVAKAVVALDRARTGQAEAAPRREALARRRKALAHAPAWRALRDAESRRDDSAEALETAVAKLTKAQEAETAARERETAATEAAAGFDAQFAVMAPAIAAARELDVKLEGAARQREEAIKLAKDARVALSKAEQHHRSASKAHADAVTRLSEAQTWLAENAALEPLAQREPDIAGDLVRHRALAVEIAANDARRNELEQTQQDAHSRWTKAQDRFAAATAAHKQTAEALANAEQAAPSPARVATLSEAQRDLAALQTLLGAHDNCRTSLADADAALVRTRGSIADADARRDALASERARLALQLPPLAEKIAKERREFDLLRNAATDAAESMRTSLVPGEPCPVCGSGEHHLTLFEGKLGEHLREREVALAALQTEHVRLTTADQKAAARFEAEGGNLERLAAERTARLADLDRASQNHTEAEERLNTAARAASLPEDLAALPDAISAAQTQASEQIAACTAAAEALLTARKAEQTARIDLDHARVEQGQARDSLDHNARALAELDRDLAAQRGEAAKLSGALDRLLAAAGDWQAQADPAAWLARVAGDWRTRTEQARRLLDVIGPLRDDETRTAADADAARTRLSEREKASAEAQAASQSLADARAVLLDGETVINVEQRHERVRKGMQVALRSETTAREAATRDLAAARGSEEQCRKNAAREQAEHERCELEFADALTASGLDAEEVAQVCSAGEATLEAERIALDALDRAVETAEALLAQSQALHERHLDSPRPLRGEDDLASAVALAQAAFSAAAEERSAAELVLREDDRVRTQTAALRADLDAKLAGADVWLKLKSLIGDREGAIFRRFAQGLTLDRLLDHANARLADLKPRYTLQRAPGGDMLVQVLDNDMGGEIRGLHNLSGGERFLVSLALALGLAEMSTASGVKIESLFIDEGFGALDPASLGQAIALLEHLHATGRRVGVISHVQELKERIAVKIEVTPTGRGTSRIEVVGG